MSCRDHARRAERSPQARRTTRSLQRLLLGEGSSLCLGEGSSRSPAFLYRRLVCLHALCGHGNRPRLHGAAPDNLGLAYANLGDTTKAIEYHERALVIAREIGDRRNEGNQLGNLGIAYAVLGDAAKTIEYYQQALVIAREIGDRRGEGTGLGNLGIAYAELKDATKAIEYYQQALVIAREIGNRRGEGNQLANLGKAYERLGDVQKALELWRQARRIYVDIRSPHVDTVDAWIQSASGNPEK